ncbi:TlpA family protein disulfide reductase [Aquibacillus saliphilus]|uniref:TlpA family protein disulfide reductase n=1 Tax=Aquibacillus saliphilus TaxID=1909422 RepID=UPI001CF05102|nr:TlpA disulfide reductase family protein [Aquibacillus saliphilus]
MKAPLFKLPYINKDENYTLSDDLGNIVLITFWTSWCADCGVDLPMKEKFFNSLKSSKVKMLTINVSGRERNYDSPRRYAEKYLTQTNLMDLGREVYDLYQCSGVPTTIIIDVNGEIHEQFDDKTNFLSIVESMGKLIDKDKKF